MNTTMNFNLNKYDCFKQVVGNAHDFQFCVHILDKAMKRDVVTVGLQH